MPVTKVVTYVGNVDPVQDITWKISPKSVQVYPTEHALAGQAVPAEEVAKGYDSHTYACAAQELVAEMKAGDETIEIREDLDYDALVKTENKVDIANRLAELFSAKLAVPAVAMVAKAPVVVKEPVVEEPIEEVLPK